MRGKSDYEKTQITDKEIPMGRLGGVVFGTDIKCIYCDLVLFLFVHDCSLICLFVEFGHRPIYAHNSSFSPPPGIIMVVVVNGAQIIIIILQRQL